MNTPPALKPWENTLSALNSNLPYAEFLRRFRFDPDSFESRVDWEKMTTQQRERFALQSLQAIRSELSNADILLWRGDIMDAALSGAELFEGLEMDEDDLPPHPEFYLHDPNSPPSREWVKMSHVAAQAFGVEGGLSLRGILVSATYPGMTERMPDEIPEQIQNLVGMSSDAILQAVGKMRPSLQVALILRARNESNASLTPPYIVNCHHYTDKPIRGSLSQMAVACRDFCEQPFVGRGGNPFPKWKRQDKPKHKTMTSVNRIVLRRPIDRSLGQSGEHVETEGKREYDMQWIVSGHRRRLAQPRKSDGKQVIYISPYIKGNPDKPLVPRFNLGHVKR